MHAKRVVRALCAFAYLAVPAALGDIFHLNTGGTVEGEVLEEKDGSVVIRTVIGTVTLPRSAIVRVEEAPSPFQEYEQRRAAAADTPAAQVELAEWCGQNEMLAERRRHLLRAIELDPNYEPARAALGHVRVGELWVDGRSLERKRDKVKAKSGDAEQVIAAIQGNWLRRIRSIRTSKLESGVDKFIRAGRAEILEIKDPLAILPLTRVLSEGDESARLLLVDALSNFAEDEALMNLAVLPLVDESPEIRDRALAAVAKRQDPRVNAQYRKALGSQNDTLVLRAAVALGRLREVAAVPELIEVLKARRWRTVEVPVREYFGGFSAVFSQPVYLRMGGSHSVAHNPELGVVDSTGFVSIRSEVQRQKVTVFRTEVLEALRSLTGQDFGFDDAAWRRWYEEQKS